MYSNKINNNSNYNSKMINTVLQLGNIILNKILTKLRKIFSNNKMI